MLRKDEDEDKNKFDEILFNIDSYHYIAVDIMSIRQNNYLYFLFSCIRYRK